MSAAHRLPRDPYAPSAWRRAAIFAGFLAAVTGTAAGAGEVMVACNWGQPPPYCYYYAQAGPSGTTIQHVCGSGHQGGPRQTP